MKQKYQITFPIGFLLFVQLGWAQQHQQRDSVRTLDEVMIESRRSIKGDSISTGLKMDGKLLEQPQNIIGIKSNLMKMQGVFDVQDALRNVSGIYTGGGGNGTGNIFSGLNNVNVRGFSGVGTFRNGLPTSGADLSQEDVALIEQIDVIKGPAGFVNAMGPAGGAINVTTKVPRAFPIADATIAAGSNDFYRASIDLGSALREKGFSYRFNAAYETQHYAFDYTQKRKVVVAPVVQYNFNKKTSLLAEWDMSLGRSLYGSQFAKIETEKTLQQGRWRSNFLADPGLPTSKLNEHYGRLVFNHEFNANWKITSQSSFKTTPLEQWTFRAGGPSGYGLPAFNDAGETLRRSFEWKRSYKTYNSQLFLNGSYHLTKDITHKLLVGADYNDTRLLEDQYTGSLSFAFNASHPDYGINTDSLRLMQPDPDRYDIGNRTFGAYIYNTFSLKERLFINLGARYSTNNNLRKVDSKYNNDTVSYRTHSFNPRVGASFLIRKDFAAFVTYDQSFEPQAGVDGAGNVWKPLQSYNTEIGLKKDWFDGMLSTSVSAYKIIRNNAFSYDPVSLQLRQVNQVRNKGIEVDVIGSPSKHFTLTANYSLINSVYSKDEYTPDLVGKRFASVPREQINAWAMYSITGGFLKGLSLGLGETSVIGRATGVEGINLPNYIKLDGTLMYQKENWYIRGTLDNITNKRYIIDGTVADRYNSDYSAIVGQTWNYMESYPFSFRIQVGVRIK